MLKFASEKLVSFEHVLPGCAIPSFFKQQSIHVHVVPGFGACCGGTALQTLRTLQRRLPADVAGFSSSLLAHPVMGSSKMEHHLQRLRLAGLFAAITGCFLVRATQRLVRRSGRQPRNRLGLHCSRADAAAHAVARSSPACAACSITLWGLGVRKTTHL